MAKETTLRIPTVVPPVTALLWKAAQDLRALPVTEWSGSKVRPVVVAPAVVAEQLVAMLYLPPIVRVVMVLPAQASTTKQPAVSPQPLTTSLA